MSTRLPPPLIHSARVLHYAIVDASIRYTRSTAVYVGGAEIGPVPRLAVCRSLVDNSVILFHCDDDWNALSSSGSGDVENVLAIANRLYDGVASKWSNSPYTEIEVAKAITDDHADQRCSFCGRYHFELGDELMVSGNKASICSKRITRLHADFVAHAAGGDVIEDEHVE